MLVKAERSGLEDQATVLNDCDLGDDSDGHDKDEHPIVEESREHIEFAGLQLSAVNFIENLHHDEHLEKQSIFETSFTADFRVKSDSAG